MGKEAGVLEKFHKINKFTASPPRKKRDHKRLKTKVNKVLLL